jgi:hypothetical protein
VSELVVEIDLKTSNKPIDSKNLLITNISPKSIEYDFACFL